MTGSSARIVQILRLGRFHFLISGFLLFVFGSVLAILYGSPFVFEKFLLGYAIILTAQLSVSYSNDYFDLDVDQFTEPTVISGGSGVLHVYPELQGFAKSFAQLLINVSVGLAILGFLLYSFPPLFLVVVIVGNGLGWYYAAPPLRLAYRGLSEITVMITTGLLIPGMGYFLLAESIGGIFLIFVVPLLMYSLAFILGIEIPDMEGDRLGQKNTVIVRHSRKFGFASIALLLGSATGYFLLLSVMRLVASFLDFRVLAGWSLMPLAYGLVGLLKRTEERVLATRLVVHTLIVYTAFLILVDAFLILFLLSA